MSFKVNYIEECLSEATKESLNDFPQSLELSVLDSLYERGFKDGYNYAKSETTNENF
jgi:hypothetical protein